MNAAKTLLEKIKAAFLGEVIPTPAPAPIVATVIASTDMTYKLLDGTEIVISQASDKPAIGDTVTVGGVPAMDATHTLEDGSTLTTTGGVITAVGNAMPITVDVLNTDSALEQRVAELENKIASMQAPVGMAAQTELDAANAKVKKLEEIMPQLFSLVDMLIKEPTADPVTLTGVKKEKFDAAAAKEARLARYADARKNIKALN